MIPSHGLNAAVTDSRFALQWVHSHIHLWGGDHREVTIWGQSSGGGMILVLAAAEYGKEPRLFSRAIASSPGTTPQGSCNSSYWQVGGNCLQSLQYPNVNKWT